MNYVDARYATNTQNQANNNECDIGTNCAITSQTQGDGSAPTNLQISKFNEREEEQVGEVPPQLLSHIAAYFQVQLTFIGNH